jgi:hypothetical protein
MLLPAENPITVKEVLTAFSKLHLDRYRQANLLQNENFETNQARFVEEFAEKVKDFRVESKFEGK